MAIPQKNSNDNQPRKRNVGRTRMTPEGRREQILKSARQMFIELGLGSVRVIDIARQAGITPAFVYHHFSTKSELYQAAVRDPLEAMIKRLIVQIDELASCRTSGTDLMEELQYVLLANMGEIGPLLSIVLFSDPEGKEFYSEFLMPKLNTSLGSLIIKIEPEARFIDVTRLMDAMFGIHFSIVLFQLFDGRGYDQSKLSRRLAALFKFGLFDEDDTQTRRASPTTSLSLVRRDPPIPVDHDRVHVSRREVVVDAEGDRRTRLQAPERRRQTLIAAREVFLEVGFNRARTKEIAERAGIGEPFMFRLFESKEELYRQSVEQPLVDVVEDFRRDAIALLSGERHGLIALEQLNQLILDTVLEITPLVGAALLSDLSRGRILYRSDLVRIFSGLQKELGNWGSSTKDGKVIMRIILGAHFGMAMAQTFGRRSLDKQDVVQWLTLLLERGLPLFPVASRNQIAIE
jgi:AcrR family transcriptional regulator